MAIVKLGDIAIEAKSSNKGDKTGCKIVGLEHLVPSNVTLSDWSEDTNNSFTKEFFEGDVLFGRRRAYLKKAAVAPFDGICSGDITVIRAIDGKVDPDLLPFIIQNDFLFEYAVGKSAGSLSPRVKWEHLKKFEINLPSMEEQKKLADTLWSINDTKVAYIDLINKTDELVKSQFIEMFGLVKENKHGYESKPITDVCDFQGGSQPPKKDWIKEEKEGYVRMLQIRDFTQSEKDNIEYVKITNSIKQCEEEDILIGRYGASVGKILTGLAGAYNVAIMRSIPDLSKLNRTYLQYYFLSEEFQNYILAASTSRAAQAGFSKEDLSRMNVLLPPMMLQEKFESLVKQSDKSKFALQEAIKDLEAMSKKIIAESLMTAGKE